MSKDQVIDINTGKPSIKGYNRKVKAALWTKMFQLMKAGLLGVVIADTKLTKNELDAMVEVWLEEIAIEEKAKSSVKSKLRMRKHRASKKSLDT